MLRPTRTHIILIAAFILALSAWVAYQKRFQIAASIWQFRHSGVLSFAGYSIPVPANWYVQNDGTDAQTLFRLDSTRETSNNSWHPHATITFMDVMPIRDVDKWRSVAISSYKSQGAEPVLRTVVTADGETFSCIGGNVLTAPPNKNFPIPMAWHCRSTGHLEMLFTSLQDDVSQSWDIVSRIRKADR
jgi:hypothetical protein